MKRILFTAASAFAFALSPATALAQDDGAIESNELNQEDADALGAMMGNLFGEAEELSAEQAERLPQAEAVVERVFPAGTYAKMMNDTMKPMMDNMMGSFMGPPAIELTKITGLYSGELEGVEEGSIRDAMAILDPAFQDRNTKIGEISIQLVTDTMNAIEPGYRAGLARAYAVRFTTEELADLNAYFATPVGAKYAGESMLIYTDPQVMSAMNEMMPAMMSMMPNMMEQIAEATEEFPLARTFSDLTAVEQAQLAQVLGVSTEELAQKEPAVGAEDATEAATE